MNRITNWLMAPSTLPKAPPWWLVFLFGGLWNIVMEQCFWGAGICFAGMTILLLNGIKY